jgi:hypothetical protein
MLSAALDADGRPDLALSDSYRNDVDVLYARLIHVIPR